MEKETKYQKFVKRFLDQEPLYFTNSFEDAKIRFEPSKNPPGRYYVKFPGEPEFLAKHGSSLVSDGIDEANEITKQEYESE